MKLTRTLFICTFAFAVVLFPQTALDAQKTDARGEYIAYVGTYTVQQSRGVPGKSQGIYAYRFQPATGKSVPIGLVAETINPSWVTIHPNHRFLYAANEIENYEGQGAGSISAFSIDAKTGMLKLLNVVSSRGAGPCHMSLDKTGKWLFVANYSAGNIAAFPVKQDGSLGEASAFVQHAGKSANPTRQSQPHAHCILPSADNRFVIVSDLGLDEVLVYRFDAGKGTLTPNDPPFAKVAPGSGPRHLALHPDGRFLYLINEIKPSVTVFAYDGARGSLEELQTISAFPEGYQGRGSGAEIEVHPNGKFLYCSIRGLNNIGVFAIDGQKRTLSPVEHIATQGNTPRHFALDPTGAYLFAEHQASNNIVMFRVDQNTGRLTPAGTVLEFPLPVCVAFLAVR